MTGSTVFYFSVAHFLLFACFQIKMTIYRFKEQKMNKAVDGLDEYKSGKLFMIIVLFKGKTFQNKVQIIKKPNVSVQFLLDMMDFYYYNCD